LLFKLELLLLFEAALHVLEVLLELFGPGFKFKTESLKFLAQLSLA
jgi:hypothetical protein